MTHNTDDLRIKEIKELLPPGHVIREFPATEKAATDRLRGAGRDPPHPARRRRPAAGRRRPVLDPRPQGRARIRAQACRGQDAAADDLVIVMRVYFEKPRTTVGWKGLINDPRLDGSFRINEGLRIARKLLLDINELGLPAGDRIPRHDHAAIYRRPDRLGRDRRADDRRARCTASWRPGLSCPVGFKNGTDGNVRIAVDAIKAAVGAAPFPVGDQRPATRRSSRPTATRTATSSCAAARRPTTMRPVSMLRLRTLPAPDSRRG